MTLVWHSGLCPMRSWRSSLPSCSSWPLGPCSTRFGAAHGFGIDLASPADAFYMHVKGDRDLALGRHSLGAHVSTGGRGHSRCSLPRPASPGVRLLLVALESTGQRRLRARRSRQRCGVRGGDRRAAMARPPAQPAGRAGRCSLTGSGEPGAGSRHRADHGVGVLRVLARPPRSPVRVSALASAAVTPLRSRSAASR